MVALMRFTIFACSMLGLMAATAPVLAQAPAAEPEPERQMLQSGNMDMCTTCTGVVLCTGPDGAETRIDIDVMGTFDQMLTILDYFPGFAGREQTRKAAILNPDGTREETELRLGLKSGQIAGDRWRIDRRSGAWATLEGTPLGQCVDITPNAAQNGAE